MKISCVINSVPRTFDADPSMKLRELLVQAGHVCVRDSDDSEGFCGSDTILMDGKPVYCAGKFHETLGSAAGHGGRRRGAERLQRACGSPASDLAS